METRNNIIKTATDLFLKNDYEDVSLNKIAKQMKITKGGIYHYFESKEALLKEVVLESIKEISNDLDKLKDEKISLRDVIKEYLSTGDLEEQHLLLLFMAIKKTPELKKDIAEIYIKINSLFKEKLIQEKNKEKLKNNIDIEFTAFKLSIIAEGILDLKLYDSSKDFIKKTDKLVKSILKEIYK